MPRKPQLQIMPTIQHINGMSGKAGLDFDNDKLSILEIDMAGKTLFAVIKDTSRQQILDSSNGDNLIRCVQQASHIRQYGPLFYTNATALSNDGIANNQPSFLSLSIILWDFRSTVLFRTVRVIKGSSGSSIFNRIGTKSAIGDRFRRKNGRLS